MRKIIFIIAMLIVPYVYGADSEIKCLARNIYHESRGETLKGQVAVALVTLNRTKQDNFPDTVCGVVYQKGQFSWTNDKLRISDKDSWDEALVLARKVMYTNYAERLLPNFSATHFHSVKVKPRWKLVKQRPLKIGNHIFY